MYLVVFVTLAVALLGAYAQVYVKQASHAFGQAGTAVTAMVNWHSTAWGLTSYLMNPDTLVEGGNACLLTHVTSTGGPTGISECVDKNSAAVTVGGGTGTACANGVATPCVTPLPLNGNVNYQFYSIAYKVNGAIYTLTYLPKMTDSLEVGLVCLPGNLSGSTCATQRVPVTYVEFYRQMGKTPALSPSAYGVISNSCGPLGVTRCFVSSGSNPIYYPVPATNVPVGTIAIIGIANYCDNCKT